MPCFLDDVDRRLYLQALREMSMRYACAIHAYVLMTNHVHLLATPETAGATRQATRLRVRHLLPACGRANHFLR